MDNRKVIINVRHGGFGLSNAAFEMYFQIKGIEIEKRGRRYYLNDEVFYESKLQRDDPILVEVVKKLSELSWGKLAKLQIVEIPYDVDFLIEDYDGYEHIAEKHRTWYG